MSNKANTFLSPIGGALLPGNILRFNKILQAQNILVPPKKVYYVDCRVTSSGNGRTWQRAFKTIAEAITANNADIDWGETPWNVDNWIFIAQGEYAEALTSIPHSCHMVGCGVLGTDGAVEIHPAAGACMAGTGLNLTLHNIRFEVTDANPVLDFGTCNNVLIEGCEIVCGVAGTGTHGISTENATHLRLWNNSFQFGGASGGFSHGIYAAGGADKYLHHSDIRGNIIQGLRDAGTGIYIQNTCTATNTIIRDNIIKVPTTGKGIDDNNGGSLCVHNWISVAGAGDAIEHAGGAGMTIDNHVVVNGTGAIEVTSS